MTSPYNKHPTPYRWKGLKEPRIDRPRAERRDSSLDALEYAAMRIPNSNDTYVIPPRREDYHASPAFAALQPPVKKTRMEDEAVGTAPKRPRENRKLINHKYSLLTSPVLDSAEKHPPLKRVRDESLEEMTIAMKNITTRDAEDVATEAVAETVAVETVTSEEELNDDDGSVSTTTPVDSTLMTFESLTCNRLKELCNEHDIAIPKGSKKKPVFVSLLMKEFSSPLAVMEQESLDSFTKEALETKCRNLGIPDTGSKSKLVQRLMAHSASDDSA